MKGLTNRAAFYDVVRHSWGPLKGPQVRALESLLTSLELDDLVIDDRWAAYMLATAKHETANTYKPIREYGSRGYFIRRYGGQTALGRRLGNDTPEEGAIYAGRGPVQLTGENNYQRAERELKIEYPLLIAQFEARTGKRFDLTVGDQPDDEDDPDNALDPAIAYAIMSSGMRGGWYTGKALRHFLHDDISDFIGARRIVNGTDCAALIGGYAQRFFLAIRAARPVLL